MDIYFERIKPLFASTGLTVRELAPLIGIPEKTIYNWENGIKSYNKYYSQIAAYFNVSIAYLKGETDIKTPAPTNEDGLDAAILSFLHSLPVDRVRGLLLALEAPTDVLDALDRGEW